MKSISQTRTQMNEQTVSDSSISSGERARAVLAMESRALERLAVDLDIDAFGRAIDVLVQGRVVIAAVGKSGHIGRRGAATLSSLGIQSVFLHAYEALHGDIGTLTENDAVLAISNSGTTTEVLQVCAMAAERGVPIVAITRSIESPLAQMAEATLIVNVEGEADPANLVPTASLTAVGALIDALALELSALVDPGFERFPRNHPGGAIGMRVRGEG